MDIISTDRAPQAPGPYSQAIRANGFIFCSGQIPIDPAAGAVTATTAADQARQAITNLRHVLEAAVVFISDMDDFAAVNGVYAELFGDAKPARSCVQAARLPKDVKIEIEAIAQA